MSARPAPEDVMELARQAADDHDVRMRAMYLPNSRDRHDAMIDLVAAAILSDRATRDDLSVRAGTAEAIVREARDVLNRLEMYAPDVGVDGFHDALHDARLLIARIDGAE